MQHASDTQLDPQTSWQDQCRERSTVGEEVYDLLRFRPNGTSTFSVRHDSLIPFQQLDVEQYL